MSAKPTILSVMPFALIACAAFAPSARAADPTVQVTAYGAKCDGSTNDTAAFTSAMTAAGPGGTVGTPAGKWCYVTNLNIVAGVGIQGSAGSINNPGGTNSGVTLSTLGGLYLEKTGTITLNGASSIKRMAILRADSGVPMAVPATDGSAYSGDCLTAAAQTGTPGSSSSRGSDGYVIDDVLCVGQSRALVSQGASRAYVNRLTFDANPGVAGKAAVLIQGSNDTFRIRDMHGWPYGRSSRTGNALRNVGTGIQFSGQNDDTQVDGVLVINYDIGVDFSSAQAIDIGRLWVDTGITGVSGTRGVRFGTNTTNINISLLEVWGFEVGLEAAGGAGNRNSIGIAHFESQSGYPVAVGGGNIHFGNMTTRSVPAGQPVISIGSTASIVSGLVNDENNGSGTTNTPVLVPANYPQDNVRDLQVVSPYRAAGTPTFGGNNMVPTSLAASDPIQLPSYGSYFAASGLSSGNIAGGYNGRQITIRSNSAGTLFYGGNIQTATKANRSLAAGSVISFIYDAGANGWIETSFKP